MSGQAVTPALIDLWNISSSQGKINTNIQISGYSRGRIKVLAVMRALDVSSAGLIAKSLAGPLERYKTRRQNHV
jgi:hypothetical protein